MLGDNMEYEHIIILMMCLSNTGFFLLGYLWGGRSSSKAFDRGLEAGRKIYGYEDQ